MDPYSQVCDLTSSTPLNSKQLRAHCPDGPVLEAHLKQSAHISKTQNGASTRHILSVV